MQSMGLWDEFLVMFMADSFLDMFDYFATGVCVYIYIYIYVYVSKCISTSVVNLYVGLVLALFCVFKAINNIY